MEQFEREHDIKLDKSVALTEIEEPGGGKLHGLVVAADTPREIFFERVERKALSRSIADEKAMIRPGQHTDLFNVTSKDLSGIHSLTPLQVEQIVAKSKAALKPTATETQPTAAPLEETRCLCSHKSFATPHILQKPLLFSSSV